MIPGFYTILHAIAANGKYISSMNTLTPELLRSAKQFGFSDRAIGPTVTSNQKIDIRKQRIKAGIIPYVKQIDTLAGEFAAQTNYLYLTYHGSRT